MHMYSVYYTHIVHPFSSSPRQQAETQVEVRQLRENLRKLQDQLNEWVNDWASAGMSDSSWEAMRIECFVVYV